MKPKQVCQNSITSNGKRCKFISKAIKKQRAFCVVYHALECHGGIRIQVQTHIHLSAFLCIQKRMSSYENCDDSKKFFSQPCMCACVYALVQSFPFCFIRCCSEQIFLFAAMQALSRLFDRQVHAVTNSVRRHVENCNDIK